MNVAVVGCLHGKLEFLYQELQQWENQTGKKVDFILCSGDFQSLRHKGDLAALECPEKYKELGQFHRYYTGELKAPILTIFVGGNHEATNYLRDLYYGGWAAENIYYLGASGFINIKKGDQSIRLGGVSGIEKMYDYFKGYHERSPYITNHDWLRTIYHIRQFEVQKCKLLSNKVDMFMSHEWPNIITQKARRDQVQNLLRFKKHFQQDVSQGRLGSQGFSEILEELRPKFWFSAHLHVKFQAVIDNQTEFLALDKPIPKRQYLDVFHIDKDTDRLNSIFTQSYQQRGGSYQNHNQGHNQQRYNNQQPQYQQKWVKKGEAYDQNRDLINQLQQQHLQEQNNQEQQLIQHQEEEEKKESVSQTINDQQLKIEHDREWIAILQATQKLMPLDDMRYDFRYLNKGNQQIMETIKANFEKLENSDMSINFNKEDHFEQYKNLHPQTVKFIQRFELDDRLFNPEKYWNNYQVDSIVNQPQIASTQQQQQQTETTQISQTDQSEELKLGSRSFQQAFKSVNDQNEIDLDLE